MHGLCKGRPPALGASHSDRPSHQRTPAAAPAAQPAATGSPAERWGNNAWNCRFREGLQSYLKSYIPCCQFYLTFLKLSLIKTRTNTRPWRQLAVLAMIHGFPLHSCMFIPFWKGSSKMWKQVHEGKIPEVNRFNGNRWKLSLNST